MLNIIKEADENTVDFAVSYELIIDSDYDRAYDELSYEIDQQIKRFVDLLKSEEQTIATKLGSSICKIELGDVSSYASNDMDFYIIATVDKGISTDKVKEAFGEYKDGDDYSFDVEFWEEYGSGPWENRYERTSTEYYIAEITIQLNTFYDQPVEMLED